ncbi:MAG: hypothetical protein QGH29_00575 [Kiritimatiellia bacterium]|jgi:hypothetical protein|nr:hypothetical protein [Kiritimatiellia bacterium]
MKSDKQDRRILQELAKQVRDIAAHPVQEERKQLWKQVNRLERCRIPVLLRTNNLYWHEVVPETAILCTGRLAREYERRLRLQIWQWANVDDDCVTEPVVEYATSVRYPRRIQPRKAEPGAETLGAYHVEPVIEGGADIASILIDTECRVDWDATSRNRE